MIKTFFDLDVYRLGNEYAMKIFKITRSFPKSETYSLTSQVVDSSRSICANIAEGGEEEPTKVNSKSFLFTQWVRYRKLNRGCNLRINVNISERKRSINY